MGLFNKFSKSGETTILLSMDVIVFIVDPTNSGKSEFLNALLQNVKVHFRMNGGRRPCTPMVDVLRCRLEGKQNNIVLVDPSSFYTYESADAEESMSQWTGSNCTKPEAAGILYIHKITSSQHDVSSDVSRHLRAFGPTSTVHVVPTISSGTNLSAEEISTSLAQLQRQAEDAGASMFGSVFDGRLGQAWDIVQGLLNILERKGH
ncbi:hypothetical protein F5J12DRAFT_342932 [Pisolithus orientalis]|uniref:uncharacterized protein n=1 Tax=Pisolithus orientalis TaxID=936130 RepID=UPI00222427A5|nr:uncharacterized protein F5J12DRAFT_342932 [Pisolithus orientalis]KAI5997313.1 hypothetical protein F5J12DRAFT_342932 [Pisolithus orientalis]